MNLTKFHDAFLNVYQNLFKSLRDAGNIFTGLTDAHCSSLSEDYFYHSYDKFLSRKASDWYTADPTTFLGKVVADALARFGASWNKAFDAFYRVSYNPLDDFALEEKRTPYLVTDSTSSTKSKVTSKSSGSEYGFDSDEAVPVTEAEATTEALAEDNVITGKVTNTGNEKIEKKGRGSSHTSQELIEEEISLRGLDFFKMIFEDLDKLICLNIY